MESVIKSEAEGASRRIYLQSPVLTPDPVLDLQTQIGNVTEIEPIPAKKLHLTLFHLGKQEDLLKEILVQNQGLGLDHFTQELTKLLANTTSQGGEIQVQGNSLSLFEKEEKPIIVLGIQDQPELTELRGDFLSRFEEFLASCGVSDITAFMQGSPNLRYQTREGFNPHISVGYPKSEGGLPQIDVSGIRLTLGSPVLNNVSLAA